MHWLGNYMVMCSIIVEHEFNFIFGMNVKGRNPSRLESWKGDLEAY